jgi:hypothetical protein
MADIAGVLKELQEDRNLIDRAVALLAQLNGNLGGRAVVSKGSRPPLSADARRRIAEAQRARWARVKAGKGVPKRSSKPASRVMSIAARRKIAAAQRARWAKLKKAA